MIIKLWLKLIRISLLQISLRMVFAMLINKDLLGNILFFFVNFDMPVL